MFVITFASCVPQKKMLYLKDAQMISETQSINYVNERSLNYKLQPGDNLYIRAVNPIDDRSSPSLNGEGAARSTSSYSEAG